MRSTIQPNSIPSNSVLAFVAAIAAGAAGIRAIAPQQNVVVEVTPFTTDGVELRTITGHFEGKLWLLEQRIGQRHALYNLSDDPARKTSQYELAVMPLDARRAAGWLMAQWPQVAD